MLIFDLKYSDLRLIKTVGDDVSTGIYKGESKSDGLRGLRGNLEELLVIEVKISIEKGVNYVDWI